MAPATDGFRCQGRGAGQPVPRPAFFHARLEARQGWTITLHSSTGFAPGVQHVERERKVLTSIVGDELQLELLHGSCDRNDRVGLHADPCDQKLGVARGASGSTRAPSLDSSTRRVGELDGLVRSGRSSRP